MSDDFSARVHAVQERIRAACARCGRDPATVHLIAVSKTHSAEQVDQIVASMREWGWTNPVLVDET